MLKIGILSFTENVHPLIAEVVEKNSACQIVGVCSNGRLQMLDDSYTFIDNMSDLIEISDVLIIDKASSTNFDLIKRIVRKSKHLYILHIEKFAVEDTQTLLQLNREAGVSFLVSQPHRYNPVVIKAKENVENQSFINVTENGLHSFSEASLYSKLIEKLDMALMFVNTNIYRVSACSSSDEFLNIRLEFNNAVNANITINQLADTDEMFIEVLSPGENIKVDLLSNELFRIKKSNARKITKESEANQDISTTHLFEKEFEHLVTSILMGSDGVNGFANYHFANIIAEEVLRKISYVLI